MCFLRNKTILFIIRRFFLQFIDRCVKSLVLTIASALIKIRNQILTTLIKAFLMKFFEEMRLFRKVATGILFVFIGLMVAVTVMAYSRKSGSTRQDMAQAQLIRLGNKPAQTIADK